MQQLLFQACTQRHCFLVNDHMVIRHFIYMRKVDDTGTVCAKKMRTGNFSSIVLTVTQSWYSLIHVYSYQRFINQCALTQSCYFFAFNKIRGLIKLGKRFRFEVGLWFGFWRCATIMAGNTINAQYLMLNKQCSRVMQVALCLKIVLTVYREKNDY